MPQTIYGGQVGSETLRAGKVLNISVDVGAGAVVQQLRNGAVVGSSSISASTTFGPYVDDMVLRISAFSGATITISDEVDQNAQRATDAKAAAVDALVSGAGNALLSPQAMYRLRSLPNTAGSATLMSSSLKLEVEAPFDSLGLVAMNCLTTPLNNFKAVVAATETFSQATQASRYQPVVGGTTYNALRAGALYGWDLVTWSAAGTATVPAGTGGTVAARLAAPGLVVSDMMPIIDVPRADGGTYPIAMYRNTCDLTGGNWPFLPVTGEFTTTGGRKYDVGQSYNDAVGTLGNTLSAALAALHWAYPIVRHSRGVASIAVIGDSHAEQVNLTGMPEPSSNYVQRACQQLSTRARPVVSQNLGLSGHVSDTYVKHAKVLLEAVRPTVAMIHVFSVNDGAPTDAIVRTQLQQGLELVRWCQARNIYPILCTPTLDQRTANNQAANHAARVWLRDRILDFTGATGVTVCDFSAMFEVVAGVDNYKAGYKYTGDDFHMSPLAIDEIMRPAAVRAISEALYRLGFLA